MTRDLFANVPGGEVLAHHVKKANADARALLAAPIERMELQVAAKACELSPGHLRQALDMSPGRNLDLQHHLTILRYCRDSERAAWLDIVALPFGRVTRAIRPRTADERLRDLEQRVAEKYGPSGVELVEQERSRS